MKWAQSTNCKYFLFSSFSLHFTSSFVSPARSKTRYNFLFLDFSRDFVSLSPRRASVQEMFDLHIFDTRHSLINKRLAVQNKRRQITKQTKQRFLH